MWAAGTVAGYNYNMEKLRIATRQSALALWQAKANRGGEPGPRHTISVSDTLIVCRTH